jgi:hypothetical protein
MKRTNKKTIIGVIFFCILNISTFAQKQISITIDDPTTKETPKLNWLVRDSIILKTLDLHEIKAALFVCGMRVDNSNGKVVIE